MPDTTYDCIVVGVGGIGSAALYHLAKRGAKVLGLDQYPVPHDKGSSHGDTRAIRLVYFEHPDYVPLLRRAYELWDELDATHAAPLFYRTGILQAGPANGEVLAGLVRAAQAHHLPIETLTATQVQTRFAGFTIPQHHGAIFDPSGGILHVDDCIRTHVDLAQDAGARFDSTAAVRHWYVSNGKVTVETDQSRYVAKKLVITPGPWAGRLLPKFSAHLQLLRKSLFWFDNDDENYRLERDCPVFLFESGNQVFYGFPDLNEKGIKVANHSGGQPIASTLDLDRNVDTNELEAASLMLRQYLPGAGHQLNHHTTCMYTMTPDQHFIVGQYPGIPEVNVVAGLSGHGFKFAPVLGEIMADLTLNGSTQHPIDFLSPLRLPGVQ